MPRRVRGRGLFAFFLLCVLGCTAALPYAEPVTERGPELCSNGRDDDLDDLADCEVPECQRFCPPPVRLPDPPVLGCRTPWVTEPLAERPGLSHCAVPDDFPDRDEVCAVRFGCSPTSLDCPYVRPGAIGGTGSESDPFGTVAEAIASAPEGGVRLVQLLPGVYREAIVVPHDLEIEGGCAVTIEDDGDPTTPLIDVRGGRLGLWRVQLHSEAAMGEDPSIAPAIRVAAAAAVTATGLVVEGPSRIVLEDDAIFAASQSTLALDVGQTTCPGELDVCERFHCVSQYECRPSFEDCTTSCPAGCPTGSTCDQLTGECSALPNLCSGCGVGSVCRAGTDAFRCVPRPCEHAIALGRGAVLSLIESRVHSDARVLLASTTGQDGPGRIVIDHSVLELESGALGRLSGLRNTLQITDSVLRSTGPRVGPVMQISESARVVIQNSELEVADGDVIAAIGDELAEEPWTAGVDLTDVLIRGWDPSRPLRPSHAALMFVDASLTAQRLAILGSPGIAILAGNQSIIPSEDERVALRDVLITGVDEGTPVLDPSVAAVRLEGSGHLEATALRIEGVDSIGLWVASGEVDLADVGVVAGRARGCAGGCDRAGLGIVLGQDAGGTLERFEVDRINGCALSRAARAGIELSGGLLRRSVAGLCVQFTVPEASYDHHVGDLVIRDNETDLVVGLPSTGQAHCLPAVAARCGTPFEPE